MSQEITIVHCPTEEEARELLTFWDEQGYKWSSGVSLLSMLNWDNYHYETCYMLNAEEHEVEYCSRDFYENDSDYSHIPIQSVTDIIGGDDFEAMSEEELLAALGGAEIV